MKIRKNSAYNDPVVDEVRKIRAKLWRQAGGTVAGLTRLLEEREAARRSLAQKNGKAENRRRGKTRSKPATATAAGRRTSKKSAVKSTVRELAGSLSQYAVPGGDDAQISACVRREVARAAAQEG